MCDNIKPISNETPASENSMNSSGNSDNNHKTVLSKNNDETHVKRYKKTCSNMAIAIRMLKSVIRAHNLDDKHIPLIPSSVAQSSTPPQKTENV